MWKQVVRSLLTEFLEANMILIFLYWSCQLIIFSRYWLLQYIFPFNSQKWNWCSFKQFCFCQGRKELKEQFNICYSLSCRELDENDQYHLYFIYYLLISTQMKCKNDTLWFYAEAWRSNFLESWCYCEVTRQQRRLLTDLWFTKTLLKI